MARPRLGIPLPYPHFMAFAPLDVWLRLLVRARIGPRYWPRLAFALVSSSLATLLTLPERVVLGVWRPWRRARPGNVVVVLGYYRTGTTHLHYLLSCDPRLRTPAWCETLAPQGYVLSWSFLRVFMIPFVSARRPQDDVAIGPDWPAEDDFALNNWALASSLPGRFVVPSRHVWFARFHDLKGLSESERARWGEAQRAFIWKISSLARGRGVLLKTPSHTARVGALRELLGPGVKFVHISREPAAVIRSNVSMAARLGVYNLEDPPEGEEVRRRIVGEYLATERAYERDVAALPAGSCVEVRYEDLIADPMGQLRRIYDGLGLEWSGEFETRARAYLAGVRGYRAANQRDAEAARATGTGAAEGEEARQIRELAARFGHDRPVEPSAPELGAPSAGRAGAARPIAGVVLSAVMLLMVGVLWLGQAWVMRDRHDWLVWPAGVLIGWSAIRAARVGSVGLGVWAAMLTLALYGAVAIPGTFLSDYGHRPEYAGWWRGDRAWATWEWYHIKKAAKVGALSVANVFWLFMGVVTAYRFASRRHLNPPGRG
ncbi:MAG: sulfotransferase [Phycisphaerales bacterium]|nr:sulfotransferase [Phycisphaerales bacterium]